MRVLVVLSFDVPEPEDTPAILLALAPPTLPFFEGTVRVVAEPVSTELEAWLDE